MSKFICSFKSHLYARSLFIPNCYYNVMYYRKNISCKRDSQFFYFVLNAVVTAGKKLKY